MTNDATTVTLEEARRRVPPAIDTLLECRGWIVDILPEPKSAALRWLLKAWVSVEDDDPLWYAVMELLGVEDNCFDADLRQAAVKLLANAAHASAECDEGQELLSLRTFEELRQAHEAIGAVLDRIREEEIAPTGVR